MFGLFKRKSSQKQDFNPPTEKQLAYARKIGVRIPNGIDRAGLSSLIAQAERDDPTLQGKREAAIRRKRVAKFTEEAVSEEELWANYADDGEFILAAYKRGKRIIVDVLMVSDANLNDRGVLRLELLGPHYYESGDLAGSLMWDREFQIPRTGLLWFELLGNDFELKAHRLYRKTVERGIKVAKKKKLSA